jgi:flagellar hook assembly protein FlgD
MIHPNPFYETTTISFELDSLAGVEIKIYDRLGRIVREYPRQEYYPGAHSVIWQAEGLPAGIYLIRLQAGTESVTRKIVKL